MVKGLESLTNEFAPEISDTCERVLRKPFLWHKAPVQVCSLLSSFNCSAECPTKSNVACYMYVDICIYMQNGIFQAAQIPRLN